MYRTSVSDGLAISGAPAYPASHVRAVPGQLPRHRDLPPKQYRGWNGIIANVVGFTGALARG